MKLSTTIKNLQEIYEKYGDMQIYACGYKIGEPHIYQKGKDELCIYFDRE